MKKEADRAADGQTNREQDRETVWVRGEAGRQEEMKKVRERRKKDQREAAGATLWLSISESLSLQSHRGDSSMLVPWKKSSQ